MDNFENKEAISGCKSKSRSRSRSRSRKSSLCSRFARILGAEILQSEPNLCVVTFNRNINAEILGRRTHSPLALAALFSFEGKDCQRKTLNLGETVILQEEINPFISVLRKNCILVTALHNHWLFESPRLMYVHFESIDEPLDFARKVAEALRVLRR
ncbi:MAG: DUF1259 domain-containing protein [Clostridiaceae bacterium]